MRTMVDRKVESEAQKIWCDNSNVAAPERWFSKQLFIASYDVNNYYLI